MGENQRDITALIERIDHPDAGLQNKVLEELSRRVDEAQPVVLSSLATAPARVRRALLRWLDNHLNQQATLPLMRYVFDERGVIAEGTGRSMAMALLLRRARTTDSPRERGRLRAFAEDVSDDEEPDVRRLAVRILAFAGDSGSIEYVENRLDDRDEEVRRTADKTMEILEDVVSTQTHRHPPQPPARLRRRLLDSAGPVRRQLIRRWRSHPRKAEIAADLIENHDQLQREALQILLREPISRIRPTLSEFVVEEPDGELAPLALRLLAKLADANPPSDAEAAAVRRGLESNAVLTRAAACRAAGALGCKAVVERLARMSGARDISVALAAARSLEQLLDGSDHELLPRLVDSLRTSERRRRRTQSEDCTALVAHLMVAIREIVSPSTIGVETLHRTVLDILEHGGQHRPLEVTGLELLMNSTPKEGFDEFDRWERTDASALFELVSGAERATARRIAELLKRGAPEGLEGLDEAAKTLWDSGHVNVAEVVVPLLDLAQTDGADRWLEQLAGGDAEPEATEARRVLRRRRNEQDVIDVEFIPRDDNA